MTELTDLAPAAAMIFVALCLFWLVWRAIRGLFRSSERKSEERPVRADPDLLRRDPVLNSSGAAPSTIPDAADVLALKASIDALARQIGALERRLSPANTNIPVELPARPARAPDVEADRNPSGAAAPVVVPDHRI